MISNITQSSLLKYWEFDPYKEEHEDKRDDSTARRQSSDSSDTTRVEHESPSPKPKRKWGFLRKEKKSVDLDHGEEKEPPKPMKKMPVIFFDEAHKLFVFICHIRWSLADFQRLTQARSHSDQRSNEMSP